MEDGGGGRAGGPAASRPDADLEGRRIVVAGVHRALVQALTARLVVAGARAVPAAGALDGVCEVVAAAAPELCVVEDALSPDSPADALRRLRRAAPAAKVVLLTTLPPHPDEDVFEHGLAEAMLHPGSGLGLLYTTLVRVLGGERLPSVRSRPRLEIPTQRRGGPAALSDRERQVLIGMAGGASNAAIAEDLRISVNTVRTHVQNLFRKLGVDRRSQIVPANYLGPSPSWPAEGHARAPGTGTPCGSPVAVALTLLHSHQAFAEALAEELTVRLPSPPIGCTSTLDEACTLAPPGTGGTVVFHHGTVGGDGVELLRDLSARRLAPLALMPPEGTDTRLLVEGLKAGVQGWISPGTTLDTLVEALGQVHQGQMYLPASELSPVIRWLLCSAGSPGRDPGFIDTLSPRELEIMRCLLTGMTKQEVADRLFLSVHTVNTHVKRMMQRSDRHSTVALIALARRQGLRPIDDDQPPMAAGASALDRSRRRPSTRSSPRPRPAPRTVGPPPAERGRSR